MLRTSIPFQTKLIRNLRTIINRSIVTRTQQQTAYDLTINDEQKEK